MENEDIGKREDKFIESIRNINNTKALLQIIYEDMLAEYFIQPYNGRRKKYLVAVMDKLTELEGIK